MNDTQVTLTDQQLTEALLLYRGDHPGLITIAHSIRLGLDKSTPEYEAHFDAIASAQGQAISQIMRESALELAFKIRVIRAELTA